MTAQQLEEELQQTRGVDEVLVPQQDQSFTERLQERNQESGPTFHQTLRGPPLFPPHHAQVCVQHRVVVGEQLLQLLREAGHVLRVAVGDLGRDSTGWAGRWQRRPAPGPGEGPGRGSPAPGTSPAPPAPYWASPAGR